MLWGAPGAGKTHLLRAAVATVEARGRPRRYSSPIPTELSAHEPDVARRDATSSRSTASIARRPTRRRASSRCSTGCGIAAVICSSRAASPLAALPLREDLRTRLGWGLVYEITPLADADKPAALAAYARGRGFRLADDVIDYLLAHGRRDMPALIGALAALDRHSLATKRPDHGSDAAQLASAATSISDR